MVKYFLKVSFTLLFLTLLKNVVFAEVKLISPYNGEILEDRVVHFKWENTDRETEYVYQHVTYINGKLDDTRLKISVGSDEEFTWGMVANRHYFWEIRYEPKESFDGYYNHKSDIFVFGLKTEIPDWAWDMLNEYNNPPQEEESEEEVEEEEVEVEENEDTQVEEVEDGEDGAEEEKETTFEEKPLEKEVVVKENNEKETEEINRPTPEDIKNVPVKIKIQPTLPTKPPVQEEDYNWNIKNSSVLGVSKTANEKDKDILCRFKYNKKDNSFEKVFCKESKIEVLKEELYPFSNEYSLYVGGNIEGSVNIQVDTYDCVSDIFKPKTWFKCNEKFLESEVITIRPHMFFRISQNGLDIPIRTFSTNGDSFTLLAGYMKNKENLKLTHTYRIINKKYNIFFDHKTELALDPKNISDISSNGKTPKPFTLPFNKIIGVTQWYGFTDYQSPHTGIDFGATREKIVAVEDGEVVGKGWDGYYGKCLSGGNFLKVKHSNGMHTTYFHLEDMFVNTGDLVKKGQTIGQSGNTGAWNCQKLAYHLHFETRLNSSYKSHTNPVPYIDVDWNKVPTLGAKYNPGRLSGENPHPGR